MKYLVAYTARRKNAKRHVTSFRGKKEYFGTIEEAEQRAHNFNKKLYKVEICTPKYEVLKTL